MQRILGTASAVAVALVAPSVFAAEGDGAGELDALHRRIDEMEKRHVEEMRALREELTRSRQSDAATPSDVDDALDEYLTRVETLEGRVNSLLAPRPTAKLLDISLSGLFAAGASTASEAELEALQAGGHDPHKRGFTVQNVELSFYGAVDPYFRGEAHVITFIDSEGETGVELEEAFLVTTSLPAGLQVKAGQYFTEFGRLNATHPHTWEFADQPVISSRMFGGDGMRGPGARVSWLAPTEFPLEWILGAQNANGETMASFVSEEPVGGRPSAEPDVRSLRDLLWSSRLVASTDLSDTATVLGGLSGAWGPNATGPTGRSRVLGADLTFKWRDLENQGGFPFLSWTTEYMQRRYSADTFNEPGSGLGFFNHEVLNDHGFYSQVTWGFRRGWTLGARYDSANGSHDGNDADPLRDRRSRVSAALTHYPSEFSKIRLQVSRDRSEALSDHFTTVWIQFEFSLGSHAAHQF
jgi:hypothetical protein